MNERIKELIESRGIILEEEHYEIVELIVLECSKWIVDNSSSMEQLGPEFFAMGLCKHFGVK
jgi:hypothetical protein